MKKYSDAQILEWHEHYKKLESMDKVGKIYGINKGVIRSCFNRLGLGIINRRRNYNRSFFSIDTPESFYWAGFIAADGCVSGKKSKYISITLAKKDHDHLEKFVKAIEFDRKLKKTSISLCSKEMFNDLARFNIVPRKTKIYTFPEWLVNHPLVNHFMRGYFDGDGSIYYSLKKPGFRSKLSVAICGTKAFLTIFRNMLSEECGTNRSIKVRKTKGIYALEYCGNNNIIKIRNFLYSNSTESIRMDRKYNMAFNDWIDNKGRSEKCKKVIGRSMKDGSYIKLNAITDGKLFGFTRVGISSCLIGKQKTHRDYIWNYL